MKIEGIVGPQIVADGTQIQPRVGRGGELVVTELHGKYFEQALRGNVFHGTAAAGALGAAATSAGVALYNPSAASGGKLVSIIKVTLGLSAGTFVAGLIMHGVNSNPAAAATSGTACTVFPAMIGSAFKPSAALLLSATLPVNPSPLRPFANKVAGASFLPIIDDVDGQIILTPGTTWSLYVINADTTPAEYIGVTWEEINA